MRLLGVVDNSGYEFTHLLHARFRNEVPGGFVMRLDPTAGPVPFGNGIFLKYKVGRRTVEYYYHRTRVQRLWDRWYYFYRRSRLPPSVYYE